MSNDQAPNLFEVTADSGSGPEVDETEVYNDVAFAWKQADELQAEADSDDEATVYGVYALVAVERVAS
jgi:hypothetical protein